MNTTHYRLEYFPQRRRLLGRSYVRWHVRLAHVNGNTLLTSHGYYKHANAKRAAFAIGHDLGVVVVEVDR